MRKTLLWVAGGLFVLSMPCILFGLLGLLGIAADVSTAENRQIGRGSLRLAAVPFGLGVIVLVFALVVQRSRPKNAPG